MSQSSLRGRGAVWAYPTIRLSEVTQVMTATPSYTTWSQTFYLLWLAYSHMNSYGKFRLPFFFRTVFLRWWLLLLLLLTSGLNSLLICRTVAPHLQLLSGGTGVLELKDVGVQRKTQPQRLELELDNDCASLKMLTVCCKMNIYIAAYDIKCWFNMHNIAVAFWLWHAVFSKRYKYSKYLRLLCRTKGWSASFYWCEMI